MATAVPGSLRDWERGTARLRLTVNSRGEDRAARARFPVPLSPSKRLALAVPSLPLPRSLDDLAGGVHTMRAGFAHSPPLDHVPLVSHHAGCSHPRAQRAAR